MIKRDARIHSL